MKLSELLDTCGNDFRFIKVYYDDADEEKDFNKNKPESIFGDRRCVGQNLLTLKVRCWHIDRKNNDLEVLLIRYDKDRMH